MTNSITGLSGTSYCSERTLNKVMERQAHIKEIRICRKEADIIKD